MHTNNKIRTALALLFGTLAVAVAVSPAASAARILPSADGVIVATPAKTVPVARQNDGRFWTSVEAFKLSNWGGGGSAGDDDCGGYAQQIEDALFNGMFALKLDPIGGAASAHRYFEEANRLDDEATDQGCVIIYTPA